MKRRTVDAAPDSVRALYRRALRRRRGPIARSFGLLALWQVCEAAVPVAIGLVVDHAVATGSVRNAVLSGIGLVLLFVVLSLSYRFGSRAGFGAVQAETHALRVEVAARALDPRGASGARTPGETLSLATSDADAAGSVLRSLSLAFASAVAIVASAVYLVRTDLLVGVVVLVGVPVVLGLLQVLTPIVSSHAGGRQQQIARAISVATDLVGGLRVLKGIGGERRAALRYAAVNADARDASIRTGRAVGLVDGMTVALSGLFLAVVALVSGQAALDGRIGIGQLIAVVGVAQHLADPVAALGRFTARFAVSVAAARRVVAYLSSPVIVEAGDEVPEGTDLALAGVAYGTLRGVDLQLAPGGYVCVVVDDAASGDALIEVLAGEARNVTGSVRLGGVELSRTTIRARRDLLIVCHHLADLFEGTVRGNIGDTDALDAVVDRSGLRDLVAADGLDRTVSAAGSDLSGGQRQRVALARALARNVPVLVLHEPTTAVDAVTEHAIGQGIREHRHGPGSTRTTLVVTNSPAYLAHADTVVFVADGAVRATGTHADLHDDPDYRRAVER